MFEWYLDADACELLAVAVIITGLLALLLWCFVVSCDEYRNRRARKRRRQGRVTRGKDSGLTKLPARSLVSLF
jgi:hypothetical protein